MLLGRRVIGAGTWTALREASVRLTWACLSQVLTVSLPVPASPRCNLLAHHARRGPKIEIGARASQVLSRARPQAGDALWEKTSFAFHRDSCSPAPSSFSSFSPSTRHSSKFPVSKMVPYSPYCHRTGAPPFCRSVKIEWTWVFTVLSNQCGPLTVTN